MKHSTHILWLLAAATLMLAACQAKFVKPEAATSTSGDADCVVTNTAYQHIHARHCMPQSGASQLLPQYCTQQGMQTFCEMVQNAPNRTRTVQPDNRIRYDANLGQVVGTAGERCGRLIITSETNGDVITEFPELNGAPAPCR
jgi:hypothetical protein